MAEKGDAGIKSVDPLLPSAAAGLVGETFDGAYGIAEWRQSLVAAFHDGADCFGERCRCFLPALPPSASVGVGRAGRISGLSRALEKHKFGTSKPP